VSGVRPAYGRERSGFMAAFYGGLDRQAAPVNTKPCG
jgi:hypothetical protein